MDSVKSAYCRFLNTKEGANAYRQFKRLLYAREDSLVQWLNPSVFQTLRAAQSVEVNVCDIGGGDGGRITRILQFLHAKFKNRFALDFVEQSKLYCDAFNAGPLARFCRTKKHHSMFEDVLFKPRYYDLIILIHSIFAFDNEYSTEKVLALRKLDGAIVVVSNAPNSLLGRLKRLVDDGFEDRRFEITDLKRTLGNLGVNYRQYSTNWTVEGS
jgi:hypothetical protein